MFSNILIGVDHHDGGRDAVALAKLWFADGAQLTLAHVSLDLLVVGSTSNGSSGRPMHRSTKQRLEREVRCPLLIIPTETPPPAS